jgi:hypothetical protein
MQFPTVAVLITLLVGFLVTQGLKSLSNLLGFDLSGYGAAVVAAVVTLLVGVFNGLIPLIPANIAPLIEPAAALIIAILGAFGVHYSIKSLGATIRGALR